MSAASRNEKQWFMMSATASGSSFSDIEVKPEISAKRTVADRRSLSFGIRGGSINGATGPVRACGRLEAAPTLEAARAERQARGELLSLRTPGTLRGVSRARAGR